MGRATPRRSFASLASRTGAVVMCSPRGKGIFPESDPAFLGVTGFAGRTDVADRLRAGRVARVLVLGTRLGEFTSFWDPRLVPDKGIVQVDVDPCAGRAPRTRARRRGSLDSEIGVFLDALLAKLPARRGESVERARVTVRPSEAPREAPRVRPEFLFSSIQRRVVDATSAIVITEAGNAFAWGNRLLSFDEPNRYRTSMGFGSMGQAAAGVIGAALVEKAVAVLGDGAMLMNNEISTAVNIRPSGRVDRAQRRSLRDDRAGDDGPRPHARRDGDPGDRDFAAFARSMGAEALRVEERSRPRCRARSGDARDRAVRGRRVDRRGRAVACRAARREPRRTIAPAWRRASMKERAAGILGVGDRASDDDSNQ